MDYDDSVDVGHCSRVLLVLQVCGIASADISHAGMSGQQPTLYGDGLCWAKALYYDTDRQYNKSINRYLYTYSWTLTWLGTCLHRPTPYLCGI